MFTALDFIKKIREPETKKGTAIVFDEAGVGIPAREWYSISNRILGKILQTFRYKNLIVIFTCPNINYMDLQARGRFHAFFETMKIIKEKRMVQLKFQLVQENPKTGKIYYKYPKFMNVRCKFSYIKRPSVKMAHAYENRKEVFNLNLTEGMVNELSKITNGHEKKPAKSLKEYAKEVFEKAGGSPTVSLIQNLTELPYKKASRVRLMVADLMLADLKTASKPKKTARSPFNPPIVLK